MSDEDCTSNRPCHRLSNAGPPARKVAALQRRLCPLSSAAPLGMLLPSKVVHPHCSSPARLACVTAAAAAVNQLSSALIVGSSIVFAIVCQLATSQAELTACTWHASINLCERSLLF